MNKQIRYSIFLMFLFFCFYRMYYLIPGIYDHVGSCILYPFLKVHALCIEPLKHWSFQRKKVHKLYKELDVLSLDRDRLFAENCALKASQKFLHDTAELREFKKRYSDSHMRLVQILTYYASKDEQYILVDAGGLSGITKHMIALYDNNLLGRVIEVYPWYSKVQLITDPLSVVPVESMQSDVKALCSGIGNATTCTLLRASHLEDIYEGIEFFSSGNGLLFPRGFYVGTLISCVKDGLYYKTVIKIAINFADLRYCLLLARDLEENEIKIT